MPRVLCRKTVHTVEIISEGAFFNFLKNSKFQKKFQALYFCQKEKLTDAMSSKNLLKGIMLEKTSDLRILMEFCSKKQPTRLSRKHKLMLIRILIQNLFHPILQAETSPQKYVYVHSGRITHWKEKSVSIARSTLHALFWVFASLCFSRSLF